MISNFNSTLLWELIKDLSEEEKADMLYCSMRATLNDKEVSKVIGNIKERLEVKRILKAVKES